MENLLNIVIILVMLVVVGILFAGLFNMFKGGSGNTSQKLMRARIIAQFLAIALLAVAWFGFNPGR